MLDACERQLTATPDDFEAQKGKAWALLGLGRLGEAEWAFERLVEGHPNKPTAYLGRAEVAMRQKDWASALERWRAALSRFPGNVRFQVGEARSLWKLGHAREAESLLRRTVAQRSDKPIAYFVLIDVATGRGNDALAAEVSRTALDRFPDDSRAWLARVRALMAMKAYDTALECIAEGKRRLPHSPNLFLVEASLHERLFEYRESIRSLQEAADRWPSDVAIALRLALNYLNVGAYDDARSLLEWIEPHVDAQREEQFARAYLRVLLTFSAVLPGLSATVRWLGKARERRRGATTSSERNAAGAPHSGALRVAVCAVVDSVARRLCRPCYTSLLAPCHNGAHGH